MVVPEYIKITDATGKTVAFLSPESDSIKDCYVECRINGESKLEFLLPSTSEKIEYLTPECKIYTENRIYHLLIDESVDTTMDESGKKWIKVMAVEIWNELNTKFIEPYVSNDPNVPEPADLSIIIVGGGTNLSGDLYPTGSAAHALYVAVQGTDWSLGTVDVVGIHDVELEKKSRLDLIKHIKDVWGGNLVWDSVNKVVSLRANNTWQNYTGFQIRYAKNLKHITRTQSNKLITKIYPFGKDYLDIASVNEGIKYRTNFTYTNNEYIGIYVNPDLLDPQELKEKADIELSLNCSPRFNYKTKISDLRVLPEYSHENFSLGDMADIVHEGLNIFERLRIISHKYNLFKPWECEIELGSQEERLIEKLKTSFTSSSFLGKTFSSKDQMHGSKLEDLSVKDEKIKSLTADKITAGTIEALIKIIGPEIIGGIIRTAEPPNRRVEMTNNQFRSYNDGDILNGLVTNNEAGSNFGDVHFYDEGKLVFSIYNATNGQGVSLIPRNGASLSIGSNDHKTMLRGDVGGVFWRGTYENFLSRKNLGKFSDRQIIEITDHLFDLGENLPTTADLSTVISKINAILDMLREMRVIKE